VEKITRGQAVRVGADLAKRVIQVHTVDAAGPVTASAVVAAVGDFKQFKNRAQFGAWIGLTPRQHSP